jgi:uncharacterized protein DUF4846
MKKTLVIVFLAFVCYAQTPQYPWLNQEFSVDETVKVIPCLSGFTRVKTDSNSFASWLRKLPLKNKSEKVRLFDNRLKPNQSAHYRIIDIDRGKKDLQQCADAVIRLRAEYLYHLKKYDNIHFNFTSGDEAKFTDWMQGLRPLVNNNNVKWKKSGKPGNDYPSFKKYLEIVFMYAGSYSLTKELVHVPDLNQTNIGDVFIQGGFPGHAVIVVEKCIKTETNEIAILLTQSYMPAQDIHILNNLNNENTSPWYIINEDNKLYTPEWTFEWSDLYKFK